MKKGGVNKKTKTKKPLLKGLFCLVLIKTGTSSFCSAYDCIQ